MASDRFPLARFLAYTIAAVFALQTGSAFSAGTTPVTPAEAERFDLSGSPVNIILISLDALRYDRTGYGGNERPVTPNLDKLASESVVFHDATSQGSWTLPSHMSIFTGLWPTAHGVVNKLSRGAGGEIIPTILEPSIGVLTENIARAGFECVAFTGDAGVSGRFGFARGFEIFLDDVKFGGMDHSVPAALDWLGQHGDERFFLFLHGYDVHGQYDPANGYTREFVDGEYTGPLEGNRFEQGKLREEALLAIGKPGSDGRARLSSVSAEDYAFYLSLYDEKVRDQDRRLGVFLDHLRATGLYEKSIIAVVSDHGEEFGEHESIDHGPTLYQEMVHVPMLIRFPGQLQGMRVDTPVRTMDIFPTVMSAVGLPLPDGLHGVSLLPLMRGGAFDEPVVSESDYRLFVHRRMIRNGPWKLILDLYSGAKELYHLDRDPAETNNLVEAEPRQAYEMEQALLRWMNSVQQSPETFLGVEEEPINEY